MKRFFIILAALISTMNYGMVSNIAGRNVKINAENSDLVTPPPMAPYHSRHHSYHKSLINPIAKRHKNSWASPVAALTAMRESIKTFFEYKPKLELPKQPEKLESQCLLSNQLLQLDNTPENKELIAQMPVELLQEIFFDWTEGYHMPMLRLPVKIYESSTLSRLYELNNEDPDTEYISKCYESDQSFSNSRMIVRNGDQIKHARTSPDRKHLLFISQNEKNFPGIWVNICRILSDKKMTFRGKFPYTGKIEFNTPGDLMVMPCGNTVIVRNFDGTALVQHRYASNVTSAQFFLNYGLSVHLGPAPYEEDYSMVYGPYWYDVSWIQEINEFNTNQKIFLLELDAQFKANTSWIRQHSIVLTEKQKEVFLSFTEPLREHLIKYYNIDPTQTALPPVTEEQQITSSSNSTSSKSICMGIGLGLAALAGGIYWYMKGK